MKKILPHAHSAHHYMMAKTVRLVLFPIFIPNLDTCQFPLPSQLSPVLRQLQTIKDEGLHVLPPQHVKPANGIFSYCCSSCIKGQHNTIGEKRYLPTSAYMVRMICVRYWSGHHLPWVLMPRRDLGLVTLSVL